jgi:hypothetical protein
MGDAWQYFHGTTLWAIESLAIDHLPFFIPRLIRMITIMTGPTMAMQKMTKMISSVVIVDIGCRQR